MQSPCQALLGRAIKLGYFHFDTRLLQAIDLSEDTWRVKDFADDGKVLKLASHKTVTKLTSITKEDGHNIASSALFLYFLQLKVYAINAKDLPPDKQVIYLMSVLCFFTSAKGFSITTMRNLVREIVLSLFLVFCRDYPHPRLATSKPIKHKFGTYRAAHGELTCVMFPMIVNKESVANAAMMELFLKNGRDANRSGYKTSINHDNKSSSYIVPSHKKSVEQVDPAAIRSSGNAVANCIWNLSDMANYMNTGAVFVKQLLKGFGCTDADFSPFLKVKWEKSDSSLGWLHQLLRQYRARGNEHKDDDVGHVMTSNVLDEQEEDKNREERMRNTLLKELLCEEKVPEESDMNDLESMKSIACLDDDSSIDSINDFNNLLIGEEDNIESCPTNVEDDMYHCIMWKNLCSMSSEEATTFIHQIAEAMSELCMHEREKGVDLIDTKQKTLNL